MSTRIRREISGAGLQGHRPRPAVRRREAPSLALSDADQPGERRAAGGMRVADERRSKRHPRRPRRHPQDHRPRQPRLHRRARGFLLLRRSRADPPPGRRRGRQAAHRAQPQRYRPHRVQARAEGPAGGVAHRARRDDRGLADGGRARARQPSSSPIRTDNRRSPRPTATILPRSSSCRCATWTGCCTPRVPSICAAWARRRSRPRASGSTARAWPSCWVSPKCRRIPTAASPPPTTPPASMRR